MEQMNTTEIWNTFHIQLENFIKKRIHDEETTKDLLQEVFIKIHNNIDTLNDETKITAWVYQVTRNTLNDYFRKEKTHNELPENLSFEDSIDLEEISTCLLCLINELPKDYRRAVFLSEIKGIPQIEVAEKLNLSYTATKSRIQRGRKLLKEKLSNCSPSTIVFGTESCKMQSKCAPKLY